jgi:hypothetical protein
MGGSHAAGPKSRKPAGREHNFEQKVAENLGYAPKKGRKALKIAGVILGCIVFMAVIGVAAYMIWSTPPEVT